ncbi:hypothetical protein [Streptosporangium sp. KLBMP 9127]|nr:hypothetical protein [Streptosporangium sp. KLBMP 9127]
MHIEQDEPKPSHITWRTQITIVTDKGYLSRRAVEDAVANTGDVAPTLDIVIEGRLAAVAPDAGLPLGYLLRDVEHVNVTAHGPGVSAFLQSVELAVEHEQQFDDGSGR